MVGVVSEPNVLVNFRLDRDRPMRIEWRATDGTPGNGYKAQVTAITLADGARLAMDRSAILELTALDPEGGPSDYLVIFNGIVGFAPGHRDRARIELLQDEQIAYDVVFFRDEDGQMALEGEDYVVRDRPRATARKLARHA